MRSKKSKIKTCIVFLLVVTLLSTPVFAISATGVRTDENVAPTAEDLDFTTYRGVVLHGNLMAADAEGDQFEFQIVRAPRRGEVELDSATGFFTYTPPDSRRNRDSFTYVAVDARGNISPEATVNVRIERQSAQVNYADMDGHFAHVAAITLAENDIFIGEQLGNRHFFGPNTLVTRGEFLAMVMRLSDLEILTDVTRTGFADDDAIADWLKPYISTAVMNEVVRGISSCEGFIFNPNTFITLGEASVMLNNAIGFADVPTAGNIMEDLAAPAWAHQATVNLRTSNIIPSEDADVYYQSLTRAEVALMLVSAIDYSEGRIPTQHSPLRWALSTT